MVRFATLPDLEAVCATAIRNANILGLNGVYSSVPANPTYPIAIVQRVGGTPAIREYLDRARIQVDVWGGVKGEGPGQPTKSDILDIVQDARVALLELEGQNVYDPVDVFVSSVEDANGPVWLPDPGTGRDRYMLSMWVFGRALILDSSS